MIHGFRRNNRIEQPLAVWLTGEVEETPLKRENQVQKGLDALEVRSIGTVSQGLCAVRPRAIQ